MQQRGLHKGDTGLKIAVCNKENILEKIAPKTSLSCCGRNVFYLIPLIREEIYVTTIEVIRKKPPNLGGPALSRQSLSVPIHMQKREHGVRDSRICMEFPVFQQD